MQGRCASVGITASHSDALVYTLPPILYIGYPVLHENKVSTVSHTKPKKEKLRVRGQVEADRVLSRTKGSAIVVYLLPPAGP